jgi:hypothetical protein
MFFAHNQLNRFYCPRKVKGKEDEAVRHLVTAAGILKAEK